MSDIDRAFGKALADQLNQCELRQAPQRNLAGEINTKIQYYGQVAPGATPSRPHVAIGLAASTAIRGLVSTELLHGFDAAVTAALAAMAAPARQKTVGNKIADHLCGL